MVRRRKMRGLGLGLPSGRHGYNVMPSYEESSRFSKEASVFAADGNCDQAVGRLVAASKHLGMGDAHAGSQRKSAFVHERNDTLDDLRHARAAIDKHCLVK